VFDAVFPALSRVQRDRERVGVAWLRATRSLTAITAPAMLGLAIVAPELIRVLLGARWESAVPIVQILALAIFVYSTSALAGTVLTAIDRTSTLLRFSLGEIVVVIPAVAVGLRWGVVGVATGYLVATVAARLSLAWVTTRALQIPVMSFLRSIVTVSQAAVMMALILFVVRLGLMEAGVPAFARLVTLVLLGIVIYVPLCFWRSPDVLSELRALSSRRPRAATS